MTIDLRFASPHGTRFTDVNGRLMTAVACYLVIRRDARKTT